MTEMRPIPGWPGYHVDADGHIYSTIARVHIGGGRFAGVAGQKPPTELRQFDRKSVRGKPTPYKSVALSRDGRHQNKYVHELVALAFIGPRPEGQEILHGPKGSTCNEASNLRYGTPEENSAERVLPRGADWYRARGLRPPPDAFCRSAPIEIKPAPAEPEHAFADLL